MKARFTADGRAESVPLTPEEAAEMRRESDEFDRLVGDLLVEEAGYLNDRFPELLQTGTTTLRSSGASGPEIFSDPGGGMAGSRARGLGPMARNHRGGHASLAVTAMTSSSLRSRRSLRWGWPGFRKRELTRTAGTVGISTF
jgi:hypothetical protein